MPGHIYDLDFDVLGYNIAVQMLLYYKDSTGASQHIAVYLNQDVVAGQSNSSTDVTGNFDTYTLFGSGTSSGWRHYTLPVGIPTWAEKVSLRILRGTGWDSDTTTTTKIANLSWRLD
jgi:hypothetical protein